MEVAKKKTTGKVKNLNLRSGVVAGGGLLDDCVWDGVDGVGLDVAQV